MAIVLVKAGAVFTGASTNNITPSFGQATTAGNLLIAQVAGNATATMTVSDATWTLVQDIAACACIAYKANCDAGETAPTFHPGALGPVFSAAVLSEWSGAATSLPLDQHAGQSGSGTSPVTIRNPAADGAANELAVVAWLIGNSKSATLTATHAWTPAGGVAGSVGNTDATKATSFFEGQFYLVGASGGSAADADQGSWTPSTGAILSSPFGQLASFKAAAAVPVLPSGQLRHRQPAFRGRPPARARFMVAFPKLWTPRLWLPAGAEA